MSKLKFIIRYIMLLFILVLASTTLLSTSGLAQDKELSAEAAAADANEDGLLQKNEAKYKTSWKWKANFDQVDCDKNGGLDGAEIKWFEDFEACPDQDFSAPIFHLKAYPTGSGTFPAVISLHSSGGFRGCRTLVENFRKEPWLKAGYAWYAPNFFVRHGITQRTRMDTFSDYREHIENELTSIISLMKADPKIDSKNIFAVGFSNGGFWASYLAGKGIITAGSSHYGVWKANFGRDMINPYPMEYFSSTSSPLLALHGEGDTTQKIEFYSVAREMIEDTPNFEDHVYEDGGHVWDCFPYFPKFLIDRNPKRMTRLLEKLIGVCDDKFDGPDREITDDAFKRTVAFFKKHAK